MSDVMLPRTLLDAGPEDSDWGDVVRRVSRARRRRRVGVVAALAAVVAVSVASAYALGHPIVDFKTSPKGPIQIVNDFGSLEVGAPLGMAPGVLPHDARRITSVTIDGKPHVLWVAPTKRGGFCAQWSDALGGCRADRDDAFSSHIDVSISGVANGCCVAMLGGSFFQSGGDRLEVSYADGATAEIPFVWVTEPIDAGFYLYRVPDAHRVEAARPTAVTRNAHRPLGRSGARRWDLFLEQPGCRLHTRRGPHQRGAHARARLQRRRARHPLLPGRRRRCPRRSAVRGRRAGRPDTEAGLLDLADPVSPLPARTPARAAGRVRGRRSGADAPARGAEYVRLVSV